METGKAKLTVLFEQPFWVGVFEREHQGRYEACRTVFGGEPRDFEIYNFVLARYHQLEFSPALESETTLEKKLSPKRARRLARCQTLPGSAGTKAQQAFQLQRERKKTERRALSRAVKEAEKDRRFQLRREKRKEKRRGR